MTAPTHEQGMLLMEYFKLWDTPADADAWTFLRQLRADGGLDDYERFKELVPRTGREWVLFDRVLCAYELAGVLMKHGLMHPDLFFDTWPDAAGLWSRVETVVRALREEGSPDSYTGLEWLAARKAEWDANRA